VELRHNLAAAKRIMRIRAQIGAEVAPSSLEGPSAEPRRQRRAAWIWRDLLGESSRSIEKCSRIRPQAKTRPSPARGPAVQSGQNDNSPWGGARPGYAGSTGSASRLRCARIRSIVVGASMLAITRRRPPQRRHVSISMANTRLRRCAQRLAVQAHARRAENAARGPQDLRPCDEAAHVEAAVDRDARAPRAADGGPAGACSGRRLRSRRRGRERTKRRALSRHRKRRARGARARADERADDEGARAGTRLA